MVRVVMKGGIWKNSEDETLKAAVMKYGMNQWGRVASLLARKSAKQCKARWFEWLDPSIVKTEWTRAEDEKLLHLAKLMPTQWRTIAPLVGRTATQCLERYEKLLDAAVTAASGGAAADAAPDADDPRRLRPGEIDPHPETKPAKPDPVDMEEDELEMLAEARARLANTKGKKAKRKQRERQLEEARRLATLQKKRELVAAGIETTTSRKRGRRNAGGIPSEDVDHLNEIALEHVAPAGLYDTTEERTATIVASAEAARGVGFKPTTVSAMEAARRQMTQEERRKEAQKKAALQEQSDLPAAIRAQAERAAALTSAPDGTRLRGKLVLPTAGVVDRDLKEIVRAQDADAAPSGLGFDTPFVDANASSLMPPPPPRVPLQSRQAQDGSEDALSRDAANLARLREAATPLVGGEGPGTMAVSQMDFTGATPRRPASSMMVTPAAGVSAVPMTPGGVAVRDDMALNAASAGRGFGFTPASTFQHGHLPTPSISWTGGAAAAATPLATPDATTPRAQKKAQQAVAAALRSGFASLPQPQNEYQVLAPNVPMDDGEDYDNRHLDLSEADRRAAALGASTAKRASLRRSAVVNRADEQLPRPPPTCSSAPISLAHSALFSNANANDGEHVTTARRMVAEELARVLEHDAAAYSAPQSTLTAGSGGGKKSKGAGASLSTQDWLETRRATNAAMLAGPLDGFERENSEAYVEAARHLISKEASLVAHANGDNTSDEEARRALEALDESRDAIVAMHPSVTKTAHAPLWTGVSGTSSDAPSSRASAAEADARNAWRLKHVQASFREVKSRVEADAKRCTKLEKKLDVLLGGYKTRAASLTKSIRELFVEAGDAMVSHDSLSVLHDNEVNIAAPRRIDDLRADVLRLQKEERTLQASHAEKLRANGGGGA
ncbi:cell division cycle 5-like protein [Pycnococcus provasolii]